MEHRIFEETRTSNLDKPRKKRCRDFDLSVFSLKSWSALLIVDVQTRGTIPDPTAPPFRRGSGSVTLGLTIKTFLSLLSVLVRPFCSFTEAISVDSNTTLH